MKRLSIPLGLALATLFAIGTAARAEERPFRADGSGFLNPFGFTGNQEEPYLVGTGEAPHLGRYAWFAPLDALALQEFQDVVPLSVRFRASNDDLLYADIETDYDAETGILAGTITFNGGTGRFADASGSATFLIMFESPVVTYDYTRLIFLIDGTINY